jgi:hypothetical protein
MPATSKAQQKLMGMAYALKKGEIDPSDASQEVKDLADSMTLDQLKDYASTKHEGLPDHVEEAISGFLGAGTFPRFDSYAANMSAGGQNAQKDRRDPMIQKFLDFIDDEDEDASEGAVLGLPGVATPQGTPGMGNAVPPSDGNVGSGDRFDNGSDDEEDRIGVMTIDDYKKWLEKWQKQKVRQ